MQRTKINAAEQSNLFASLDAVCRSVFRRGVSYQIVAHSETVANIILTINGRRGMVQKNIVLVYNEFEMYWDAYCEDYRYTLQHLSDVNSLMKSQVIKVSTLVSKI